MDGTLIDSEPYWIAAEEELADIHGGSWSKEQALQCVGNSLVVSAGILQQAGVDLPVDEIVEELLDRVVARTVEHVPWRPGAQELFHALADAGVPCALVTASYARFAAVVAEASQGALTVVVPGDAVTHGKPDPECFLTAARLLNVPPEACVAIEDSRPGIAAAMASGARTLGVECMLPIPVMPGLSRARSLSAISLDDVCRIAAGEVLDR
jgi:HAD superfamily hydrolase (TIGR01509 family)